MPLSQASQNLLACLSEVDAKYQEVETQLYQRVPPSGYWISMLAGSAVKKSNDIVDHNPRYASADHGANFQCLLTSIRKSSKEHDLFECPFFDGILAEDNLAQTILQYEHACIYIRHMRLSVENELWIVEEPSPRNFKIALAPKHQRSALHLISIKAQFLKSSEFEREILKCMTSDRSDSSKLMLSIKLNDLAALTVGVKKEWEEFLAAIGIDESTLVNFLALIVKINASTYRLWFKEEELIELMEGFEKENKLYVSKKDRVINVISMLSVELENVLDWGVSVPFVKFNEHYLRWPFTFHVLHPGLTALAILMKRGQKEWDKTVGSQSAKVAHYITDQLVDNELLILRQCKIKEGVGDVDIGILDIKTGNILICEVKTVFDRFRTNHQLSNFVEQRVNYVKAVKQLRATEGAIKDGRWMISDLFDTKTAIPTSGKIFKVILTWWDIFDPFKGTADSEIATSNFDAFIYLYNEAAGDIAAVYQSLIELSALTCPAYPREDFTEIENLRFDYSIDAQTDIFPPEGDMRRKSLSQLSARVIQDIASLPDNWKEQAAKEGYDPEKWIF